jgi:hypothetical protein
MTGQIQQYLAEIVGNRCLGTQKYAHSIIIDEHLEKGFSSIQLLKNETNPNRKDRIEQNKPRWI